MTEAQWSALRDNGGLGYSLCALSVGNKDYIIGWDSLEKEFVRFEVV